MKISISKNKEGNGYYTTIKNNYNNEETKMYMSVQLKKGIELEYGVYDVDCFLSCYKGKDGTVHPKIVVTQVKGQPTKDGVVICTKPNENSNEDVFADFGNELEIEDNLLD